MKEQQKALRTLIRAIGAYNRFIKTYTACQKKIQSMPLIPVPLPDTTHVLNSATEDTDMSQKDIVKDSVM